METPHSVQIGERSLPGILTVPENAKGLIVLAHGDGPGRHAPHNAAAARSFEQVGFATLSLDLLTEDEAADRQNVSGVGLLAGRLREAVDWTGGQDRLGGLPIGLFGVSTGGGAALVAAAASPVVRAVVSRGGRPDLAADALRDVRTPTLLVVGGNDIEAIARNKSAAMEMNCVCRIIIIPGAGRLFEEPGALDHLLAVSGAWFLKHLPPGDTVSLPFNDRTEAGRLLAHALAGRTLEDPIVYALPRGGIPVAKPIADTLRASLDLLMVRKIGVPWQPELAAASVVNGKQASIVTNDPVMHASGLSRDEIDDLASGALDEIERRRRLYMPGREPESAEGRSAIIVDDGIATGTSMRAALIAVRKRNPAEIIIAVPVAAQDTLRTFSQLADDVVALAAPERFGSVGQYYRDFHQLTDEEVLGLLGVAARG